MSGEVDKEEFEFEKVWTQFNALKLMVKPECGSPFEPIGGIALVDYAEELGDETGREIRVLGLPFETFIKYFREAHDSYSRR